MGRAFGDALLITSKEASAWRLRNEGNSYAGIGAALGISGDHAKRHAVRVDRIKREAGRGGLRVVVVPSLQRISNAEKAMLARTCAPLATPDHLGAI